MKPGDQQTSQSAADLAGMLATVRVAELARNLAADPQVEDVWKQDSDPAHYVELIEDTARPAAVRFAAVLVLELKGHKAAPATTAEVYAAALETDLVGWAYPWGKLWAGGDELGSLGRRVVALGPSAVPALRALLDDTTPREGYLGSEEATEMSMRGYRVKDFAAYYLAKINGAPLAWTDDVAARDAAIEQLK